MMALNLVHQHLVLAATGGEILDADQQYVIVELMPGDAYQRIRVPFKLLDLVELGVDGALDRQGVARQGDAEKRERMAGKIAGVHGYQVGPVESDNVEVPLGAAPTVGLARSAR